jgi:hypothetical protein
MKPVSVQRLSNADAQEMTNLYLAEVDGKRLVVLLDPGTVALLKEIGLKLLAGLGVKALEGLFGKRDSLKSVLEDLVKQIADALQRILDLDQLRDATQDIATVQLLFEEYMNSPATNADSLSAVKIQSAFALNRLQPILPLGATAYAMGALVRIAALQEQYLRERSAGDLRSMQAFAGDSATTLEQQLDILNQRNESRVTEPTQAVGRGSTMPDDGNSDTPEFIVDEWFESAFTVDGRVLIVRGATADEAIRGAKAEANRHRKVLRETFQQRVGVPLSLAITDLRALANWTDSP